MLRGHSTLAVTTLLYSREVLVICSAVAPHTISSLVGRTENLLVRILVWYVCRDLETVALVNSTEIEIHRDVDLIISGIGSHLKCTLCVGRRCATAGKVFFCVFLTASRQKSIQQQNTDLCFCTDMSDPKSDPTDVCMMHTSAQIFFLLFFDGKKSRRKVDWSVTLKKILQS